MKSKRLLSSWNVEHAVEVNVDFSATCLHDLGRVRKESQSDYFGTYFTVPVLSWHHIMYRWSCTGECCYAQSCIQHCQRTFREHTSESNQNDSSATSWRRISQAWPESYRQKMLQGTAEEMGSRREQLRLLPIMSSSRQLRAVLVNVQTAGH